MLFLKSIPILHNINTLLKIEIIEIKIKKLVGYINILA